MARMLKQSELRKYRTIETKKAAKQSLLNTVKKLYDAYGKGLLDRLLDGASVEPGPLTARAEKDKVSANKYRDWLVAAIGEEAVAKLHAKEGTKLRDVLVVERVGVVETAETREREVVGAL